MDATTPPRCPEIVADAKALPSPRRSSTARWRCCSKTAGPAFRRCSRRWEAPSCRGVEDPRPRPRAGSCISCSICSRSTATRCSPAARGAEGSPAVARVARRRAAHPLFADHVVGHGEAFFEQATRLGVEGIVSKRRDSVYQPGRRSGWLKIKCLREQPFVVGGYTDQEGMVGGLGALLVGHYEDGRLTFAGRVGTGFTQKISSRAARAAAAAGPDDEPVRPAAGRAARQIRTLRRAGARLPRGVCRVDRRRQDPPSGLPGAVPRASPPAASVRERAE